MGRSLVSGAGWRIAMAAAAIACAAQDTTTLEGERGTFPALAAPADCANVRSSVLASGAAALSVEDRSLVGSPAGYLPDASLRAREAELVHSQRARRAA
ncbi:MAG TPA: hypothetical protein VNN80_22975, partial [Polyangiaceae bacterium]|nr:hypothetical protein [Polyangiaceae bacterium]